MTLSASIDGFDLRRPSGAACSTLQGGGEHDGTAVATRADGEGSVLVRSGSDELPVVGD